MPTWPDIPHDFEVRRYQDALPDQLVRSQIRDGREKRRRLPDRTRYAPISGVIIMTQAEYATLEAFYEMDIGNGALAFDFPDPNDTAVFVPVAFVNPPRLTTLSSEVRVRVELERQ